MTTTTIIRTAYLTGDTFRFRDILREHRWRWDGASKAWTFTSDWRDEAEVMTIVRGYPGIRNRGHFAVRFSDPLDNVTLE